MGGSSPKRTAGSTAFLAVDTGGTFTDLVLLRDGRVETLKVPSTPADPAQAVLDGSARILGEQTSHVLLHGSTVATNALLERRGSRVVLITNRGFEDVIEIGRQNRPQLYALVGHRSPPLVAREDRLGAPGRLGPAGEEVEPIDSAAVDELVEAVEGLAAETVAVCLLHSYANGAHEAVLAEALRARGHTVSVSSELLPEFREYERTSTTVVNAYIAPVMSRYLGRLSQEAGAERVTIMGSHGGAFPVERARREPVHTVLSGPAGGVVGALAWGRRAGFDRLLSFDMGGTSTDVSLVPGEPLRTREFEIAGQPVAIPVIDIHTVGAGGGSLARLDPGGVLRVGPQSAGADPGPICYGRGGRSVTVTDAHVWLGRLPAEAFLGGTDHLDRELVRGPMQALAEGLGSTPEEAAEGVLAVADAAMERALRVISVERGYDPADFAVVAFGGAGALHVAELTARLGARTALVPPDPGLLSAYGMLTSPITREASRTVLVGTDAAGYEASIQEALAELESRAHQEMLAEGADSAALTSIRWVDARYRGQAFELRVGAEGWVERFHDAHEERYGYRRAGHPVEAVTLRAAVTAPPPRIEVGELPERAAPKVREHHVVHGGASLQAGLVLRRDLGAGARLEGPLVVQEYSATTWVPPGWTLSVDPSGCLVMRRS